MKEGLHPNEQNIYNLGVGEYCQYPAIVVDKVDNVWVSWVTNRARRDSEGNPVSFYNEVFVRNKDGWNLLGILLKLVSNEEKSKKKVATNLGKTPTFVKGCSGLFEILVC